jgi:hypothetical protein
VADEQTVLVAVKAVKTVLDEVYVSYNLCERKLIFLKILDAYIICEILI